MKLPSRRGRNDRPPSIALLLLTLLNVTMQLASAVLIKLAAMPSFATLPLVIAMLSSVIALNFGRFTVWNAIHKRYPVSLAYPLSALFFPAVVAFAWIMDEPIGFLQIAGSMLVMAGVIWILVPGPNQGLSLDG